MAWEFIESRYDGFSYLLDENGDDILVPGGENDGDFPICWMGEDMSDHVRRLIEVSPDLLSLCQRVEELSGDAARRILLAGPETDDFISRMKTLQTDIHNVISQIPEVTDE